MTDFYTLRARWVFPISQPPIRDGWVQVQGDTIVDVGRGAAPLTSAVDLGDVALMPKLVNAHTHLEFSDLEKPIGEPGTSLANWIGQVVAARSDAAIRSNAATNPSSDAIREGFSQSSEAGVGVIGEIASPPCDYQFDEPLPTVYSFAEVLGLRQERYEERLQAAQQHIQSRASAGISPHAPYSTAIPAIERCVEIAKKKNRVLAMHVAESPDERRLLERGDGPFKDALESFGAWQDGIFPWSGEPLIDLIENLAAAPQALLIHGNDFRANEIQRIARHSNLSVVYCPRTHAFFGYERHPVTELIAAGVNVALGTDSRASNPDLNLWKEVQFLLKHRLDVDPNETLSMATGRGAMALGFDQKFGSIKPGAIASFGVVATKGETLEQVFDDFSENDFRSGISD